MTRLAETILTSPLASDFRLVHFDTSDHREIGNIGRLDTRNVALGVRHVLGLVIALFVRRPELVHVPIARNRVGVLRDALFLLAVRVARRPAAVAFHARGFHEFFRGEPRWFRALVRTAFGGRTSVTVLSASRLHEFEGLVPAERVHVVPNGIADPGAGSDAGQRAPLVLHLTTLRKEKGTFELIDAMETLRGYYPDARFVLAGPWADEDDHARALRALAARGLDDVVELPGAVHGEEKWELLRRAAVLVLPSWSEGQPYVILEAFACGTPVIATRVGAIPESVDDGVEGFLVDVHDAVALADRLGRVLGDEELRSRMGRAARARYEHEFSVEIFAQRLAAVWRAAISADGAADPASAALTAVGRAT
jgi:glycosyltransferase involved in cell wall biosynthesis